MPPAYNYAPPRGRSLGSTFLFGAVFLLIGAAGIVGTLFALGVDVQFWKEKKPDRTGMIPVPTAARKLSAYNRIVRDDIMVPGKAEINYTWLPEGAVPPGVITDFNKIIGRVLKHDKNPSFVFTEKEFFPEGTTAGITAAVPPGKRSFVFEAEKVAGMPSLRPGDHFDIMASQSIDDKPNAKLAQPPGLKRASIKPVVRNGTVLTGVTVRNVAYSSSGLTSGVQYKTRPVHEMTIAVEPDEVGALTECLAVNAQLTCVARSGQPTQEKDVDIEAKEETPPIKLTTVEMIVGGKKEQLTFPEPNRPTKTAALPKGGI